MFRVVPSPACAVEMDAQSLSIRRREFDLVVPIDPEAFGTGIEGAVDRHVA